jgi:hypothetical protein
MVGNSHSFGPGAHSMRLALFRLFAVGDLIPFLSFFRYVWHFAGPAVRVACCATKIVVTEDSQMNHVMEFCGEEGRKKTNDAVCACMEKRGGWGLFVEDEKVEIKLGGQIWRTGCRKDPK